MNEETKLLIKHERMLLPKSGSFVTLVGNHYASRGCRIPYILRSLGIQHMDIYWAYDEVCPWHWHSDERKMRDYPIDDSIEYLLEWNKVTDDQLTYMALHTPSSQLVRAWRGEVSPIKQDDIDYLLKYEALEIHHFSSQKLASLWDEATRDIIGCLMLDGLNKYEAQAELFRAGELDSIEFPDYFYRPVGWYREQFCEE